MKLFLDFACLVALNASTWTIYVRTASRWYILTSTSSLLQAQLLSKLTERFMKCAVRVVSREWQSHVFRSRCFLCCNPQAAGFPDVLFAQPGCELNARPVAVSLKPLTLERVVCQGRSDGGGLVPGQRREAAGRKKQWAYSFPRCLYAPVALNRLRGANIDWNPFMCHAENGLFLWLFQLRTEAVVVASTHGAAIGLWNYILCSLLHYQFQQRSLTSS